MKTLYILIAIVLCLFCSKNEIYSQAPTNGLVAYYPFNGGAADESGSGRNGIISGGIVLTNDRFGNANKAYSFNGSNSAINVSNWNILTGNSARTMSLWFKTNTPTITQIMLSWGGNNNSLSNYLGLFVYPNFIYVGFAGYNNDLFIQNPFQYFDNRWHLMLVTFDGNVMNLYFDGVLLNTRTGMSLITGSSKLTFGSHYLGTDFFNGSLDDIRIYDRALTATEVQQTYIAESPAITTSDIIKLGNDKFIHSTGSENTFVGLRSGAFSNGVGSTFVGRNTGISNTGSYNSFYGVDAGRLNTSGQSNTFLGKGVGEYNSSGSENTFLGYEAGRQSNLNNSVIIGKSAGGWATSGTNNTIIGWLAGIGTQVAPNVGSLNTFIGSVSGAFNTSGNYNTFLGASSGYKNTVGSNNTFLGHNTGYYNTIGEGNTFNGFYSGFNNTSGSNNTFNGRSSGEANTTGRFNTFAGHASGLKSTIGENNTFSGYYAGSENTSGMQNTYIGSLAGQYNVTGSFNTYLGAGADGFGANRNNLSNATAIGANAKVSISNAIVLGDTANVNLKVGIGTKSPSKKLEVRSGNPNESGIRTSNLTATSPTISGNGKVLTVNTLGDIILVPDGGSGTNTHSDTVWVRTSANTNYIGENVGIGVPIPQYKLDVAGPINIRGINGNQLLKLGSINFLRGYKNFNGAFGFDAEVDSNYHHSTAIGYKAFANADNVLVLGGIKENAVNVGIGNSAPTSRLEITSGEEGKSGTKFTNLTSNWSTTISSNKFLGVDEEGNVKLYNLTSNNVLIKLKSVEDWSDNVFVKGSKLLSLPELERFIQQNNHLPNIPSASEMVEKGISVEQMMSKMLKNQEEMTLHLIEMKKEIEFLKRENLKLRRKK